MAHGLFAGLSSIDFWDKGKIHYTNCVSLNDGLDRKPTGNDFRSLVWKSMELVISSLRLTASSVEFYWNMARLEDSVASIRLPLSLSLSLSLYLSVLVFRCVFFRCTEMWARQMATSYQWLCHHVSEAFMKQCQPVIPSLHETNIATSNNLSNSLSLYHTFPKCFIFVSDSHAALQLPQRGWHSFPYYLSGNFDHAIICCAHWCLSLLSSSPFLTNPVKTRVWLLRIISILTMLMLEVGCVAS